MSAELNNYMHVIYAGTLDLISGYSVASIIDVLFRTPIVSMKKGSEHQSTIGLLADIFLQLSITLVVNLSVHSILYPESFIDPLGAAVLINCMFQQPSFWDKLAIIRGKIFGFIFPTNTAVSGTAPFLPGE